MDLSKFLFTVAGSLIVFGILGGFDPTNTVFELLSKSVVTGLVLTSFLIVNEVKMQILSKL